MTELDALLHEQIIEAVRQRDSSLVPGLEPSSVRDLVRDLIDMFEAESDHDHNDCAECEQRDIDAYSDGQDNHPHGEIACDQCRAIGEAARGVTP